MTLRLRPLTEEENRVITQLCRSTKEEARLIERARIIASAREGLHASQMQRLHLCSLKTARKWIKRFNARGLEGLLDAPREGAPVHYEVDVRVTVIATALRDPKDLGLPFGSWTMQRLCTYLHEQGISMGKTRMFEILQEEGLRWRKQEGWFGERVDPEFAEKRGRLNSSAVPLPTTAPSSISTKWDP